MERLLIALIIVSSVTACAQTKEKEGVQADAGLQAKKQVIKDCRERWQNPKFDAIRGKISAFENDIPTHYTIVEDTASEEEKEILLEYADLRNSCQNEMLEAVVEYYGWSLPGYHEYRQRSRTVFAELYAGNISYGEYNKLAQQSRTISKDRYDKLAMKYNQLPVAARRNEIEAQNSRLDMYQDFAVPESLLQGNMTHTDCHWVEQEVSCTSF